VGNSVVTIVPMGAFIGIRETKIATADSIAVGTGHIITREKDRGV